MNVKISGSFLDGSVELPASKSYLHRALIAASLCDEVSVIKNITLSNDIMDTIKCLEALGTTFEVAEDIKVIPAKYKNNEMTIKESGTTYRMMIPVLSAFFSEFRIKTDKSLRRRPIDEYEKLGLTRKRSKHNWKFSSGDYVIDGSISSQYISGLLFALPLQDGDSKITVKNMSSSNYIKMSIEVLKAFGIEILQDENVFTIKGNQKYSSCEYVVEPDFSALAFWAVAGTVNGSIKINAPETSLQADYEIINLLKAVADLEYKNGYHFKKSHIVPFKIDVTDCPDLAPALAVLAMYADGPCEIKGIEKLRYKESNRIKGIEKLNKFNASIEINESIKIKQSNYLSSSIKQNDHRIAMMAAILPFEVVVKNIDSVEKSYPNFINDLVRLGKKVEEV